MRVLYAPDSYGGFLTAPQACARVRARLARRGLTVAVHPMSDGGDGLLSALRAHAQGRFEGCDVPGPMGDPIGAPWLRMGDVAVIESARAIGLAAGGPKEPMAASSAGLGALVGHAADRVDGPLVIGLGGTATVDGGLGAVLALGLAALDTEGRALPPGSGAEELRVVSRLVGAVPLVDRLVRVLADVADPLAAAPSRYGPQKGLRPEDVAAVESGFARWADVVDAWRTEHGLVAIPRTLAGGGAAGGLGWTLSAVLDAPVLAGAAWFARLTRLDRAIEVADAVVAGEGRLDATSFSGKVAGEVLAHARSRGATVAALVGTRGEGIPAPPEGPDAIFEAGVATEEAFGTAIDALGNWLAKSTARS